MPKKRGLSTYRKYWEEQLAITGESPWAEGKIAKLTISKDFKDKLNLLKLSSHSLTNETEKLTLRLKVPYNYYELDNFQLKAIELLGIEKNWLTSFSIDESHCTHNLKN